MESKSQTEDGESEGKCNKQKEHGGTMDVNMINNNRHNTAYSASYLPLDLFFILFSLLFFISFIVIRSVRCVCVSIYYI